jgi:DNA excision repair protein ERCC-2
MGESEKIIYDSGIYTLEDVKNIGIKTKMCPYFLCKKMIGAASIIVYNYMYMLDPKISEMIRKEMKGDSVVVFDEAHNIDDVCIEAYTVEITRNVLEHASKNLDKLKTEVDRVKRDDVGKLEGEYKKLLEVGLIS